MEKYLANLDENILYTFLEQVDSTNTYLLASKNKSPHLVVTNKQTSGRGQSKNKWVSCSSDIIFSISFELENSSEILKKLSKWQTLAATSIAEVLEKFSNQQIQIKWPNDLFIISNESPAKFGGVLVETVVGRSIKVVTGIGINISQPNNIIADYPQTFYKTKESKEDLIVKIVNHLYLNWNEFIDHNYKDSANRFNRFDILYNKEIIIKKYPEKEDFITTAKGISENGFLLIVVDNHLIELNKNYQIRLKKN